MSLQTDGMGISRPVALLVVLGLAVCASAGEPTQKNTGRLHPTVRHRRLAARQTPHVGTAHCAPLPLCRSRARGRRCQQQGPAADQDCCKRRAPVKYVTVLGLQIPEDDAEMIAFMRESERKYNEMKALEATLPRLDVMSSQPSVASRAAPAQSPKPAVSVKTATAVNPTQLRL